MENWVQYFVLIFFLFWKVVQHLPEERIILAQDPWFSFYAGLKLRIPSCPEKWIDRWAVLEIKKLNIDHLVNVKLSPLKKIFGKFFGSFFFQSYSDKGHISLGQLWHRSRHLLEVAFFINTVTLDKRFSYLLGCQATKGSPKTTEKQQTHPLIGPKAGIGYTFAIWDRNQR